MKLPDLPALNILIHCPVEPDKFGQTGIIIGMQKKKIISAALKGLYLKDTTHSLQRGRSQTEGALCSYCICLGYWQEVVRLHRRRRHRWVDFLQKVPFYY